MTPIGSTVRSRWPRHRAFGVRAERRLTSASAAAAIAASVGTTARMRSVEPVRTGSTVTAHRTCEGRLRDPPRHLGVLLEPPQGVLVPPLTERHVDPKRVARSHELVGSALSHPEEHLELVVLACKGG